MEASNQIVHGLWIGSRLSALELLTIRSYLRNGHRFQLWLYDEMETPLPPETECMDATEILGKEFVFSYKNSNTFGHGKGSVSGFSDIFRYKLLYEKGGWWTDMDLCCLKPLDHPAEYVFRDHHDLPLVGNLMKCPAGSDLMKQCFENGLEEVDAENTDWHKPIRILCDNVRDLGLEKFILHGITNADQWPVVRSLLMGRFEIPADWYGIHWMNEEWRWRGIDKTDLKINSSLGELMQRYGLMRDDLSRREQFVNGFRHSGFFAFLEQMRRDAPR